jgi:hypothetical protein
VRRGGREKEGGWGRDESLGGNKLGKKLLIISLISLIRVIQKSNSS